jgi:hypothetical protein
MPRKQRFKPSRKPKQPQTVEGTEVQRTATPIDPPRPQPSEDIETAQPTRSQVDTSAVIEDTNTGPVEA